MKNIFVLFCTFLFSLCGLYAQKGELIQLTSSEYPYFINKTEYKYPVYTRAKISLKNGEMASVRINYNNFTHIVTYIDNKGDTLEIANPEDIDYITVAADTIFQDNGYIQWVASSSTARLGVRTVYKVAYKALVGAFGTASPAKHVEGYSGIVTGVARHHLSTNEVITLSKETFYFISPLAGSKTGFLPITKKNIVKLFPKKNIDDFMKENRINLNKEQDLVDLLVYISKAGK